MLMCRGHCDADDAGGRKNLVILALNTIRFPPERRTPGGWEMGGCLKIVSALRI